MTYGFPNEEGQIYPNVDSKGMIEGLKEAQEELEGPNQYENEYEKNSQLASIDENTGAQASFLAPQAQNEIELHLENYAKRIQAEKSRLQEAKAFIEDNKDKIDERLARMKQLEESIKKMMENMQIINTELSEGKKFHEEFSRQVKEKL